jgi:hypothetical protein
MYLSGRRKFRFDPVAGKHELFQNDIGRPKRHNGAGRTFQKLPQVVTNTGWKNAVQVLERCPSQVRVVGVQGLKSDV